MWMLFPNWQCRQWQERFAWSPVRIKGRWRWLCRYKERFVGVRILTGWFGMSYPICQRRVPR